ncbi:MAG: aquaporin [Nitriliruptorales bacterium]
MLARQALAEFIGTGFLLMAVVGSGIAASRLSPADAGLQLLQAAVATGAALTAIILAVGPVSGAHLNPAVTLAARLLGGVSNGKLGVYLGAQLAGAVAGTLLANLMFDLPALSIAVTSRTGPGQWLGEAVATFGLMVVIFGRVRSGAVQTVAFAVGGYIAAAYFFTSSTSFANPAVTVARTLSDTFAGISPAHVPAFVAAQLLATIAAVAAVRLLYPAVEEVAQEVVVPHPTEEVHA